MKVRVISQGLVRLSRHSADKKSDNHKISGSLVPDEINSLPVDISSHSRSSFVGREL